MNQNETDVLIINGDPAGTAFGSPMRKRGFDATLLEKSHHPVFYTGESLLPMKLHLLGNLDVLEDIGAISVAKHGADFIVGNGSNERQAHRSKSCR